MRLKIIEQVFWSTVDKLDVIECISLANFMVGVACTDVFLLNCVIGFCTTI